MKNQLNFRATFWASLILFTVSYVVCIVTDVLFGWTMYEIWAPLMPGFNWPVTLGGFIIGLIWIVGYSLYLPALFVLPYNYFLGRQEA